MKGRVEGGDEDAATSVRGNCAKFVLSVPVARSLNIDMYQHRQMARPMTDSWLSKDQYWT